MAGQPGSWDWHRLMAPHEEEDPPQRKHFVARMRQPIQPWHSIASGVCVASCSWRAVMEASSRCASFADQGSNAGWDGDMKNNTSPRAAVFVILFGLVTVLIIYSSNSRNEVFHYTSGRAKPHLPSSLKKWGVRNGYLPASGNKTLDRHCNQCVIITSSSHLLGSKLGAGIDRSECTIRMNDAPTTGYEVDVGNKTTFRVVAHSSIYRVLKRPQEFVNKTPETTFIFWGPPVKMQKSLIKIIQRASVAFPNMTAFVVAPERMKQFDDLFRKETGKDRVTSRSWLSTGWFTMVIAVELCDQVHVYGMVSPNYCIRKPQPHKMPYHYYEPKGPDECATYIHNERSRKGNHHRFITEKRVFAKWARLYNITFSHPDWD